MTDATSARLVADTGCLSLAAAVATRPAAVRDNTKAWEEWYKRQRQQKRNVKDAVTEIQMIMRHQLQCDNIDPETKTTIVALGLNLAKIGSSTETMKKYACKLVKQATQVFLPPLSWPAIFGACFDWCCCGRRHRV